MDLYNLKIIESGKRIEIYKINNYAVIKNNESKNKTGRKGKTEISEKEKELKKPKINPETKKKKAGIMMRGLKRPGRQILVKTRNSIKYICFRSLVR